MEQRDSEAGHYLIVACSVREPPKSMLKRILCRSIGISPKERLHATSNGSGRRIWFPCHNRSAFLLTTKNINPDTSCFAAPFRSCLLIRDPYRRLNVAKYGFPPVCSDYRGNLCVKNSALSSANLTDIGPQTPITGRVIDSD